MDLKSVIRIVESHADKISEKWIERLHKEGDMEEYLRLPVSELLDHVGKAYEEIGGYLDQPAHEVIAGHFTDTGRRRRREGVPLRQVIRAIQLARSVLWQYVVEQGIFDSTANLYQALNLHRQIVNFFDAAVLLAAEGYGEEKPEAES